MSGTNEDSMTSPRSRLKLLCSYGGKILPRPDGSLKYVGGETRVVSAPRFITFADLKEKIGGMFNNTDVVMKYQVIPEDLDILVSIRSDEDLHYMLEEYDRHESLPRSPSSFSLFRVFLFPSVTLPTTPRSPSGAEVVNASGIATIQIPNHSNFTTSNSVCTSPTSTSDIYSTGEGRPSRPGMHRVRSTPNLSGSLSQLANNSVAGSLSGSHQKSRMGGSQRYEAFASGQRRNYISPFYNASAGGHGGHPGHAEVYHRSRSGHSSFQFSGQPPVAPRRNIWE